MIRFITYVLLLSFLTLIHAQAQSDFYDPYDYNLRNYRDSGISGDAYKEYALPPKFEKPPLVTPKNVQKPVSPSAFSIPGLPSLPMNPPNITSPTVLNPYTGEINYDLMRQQDLEKKHKKEAFQNKIQSLKTQKYKESKTRRFMIIFFMTFPFATALTYGIAYSAKKQKTQQGSIFIGVTSVGLSSLNAWHDMREMEIYNSTHDYLEPQSMNDGHFSNIGSQKNHKTGFSPHVYITLAEKKF